MTNRSRARPFYMFRYMLGAIDRHSDFFPPEGARLGMATIRSGNDGWEICLHRCSGLDGMV